MQFLWVGHSKAEVSNLFNFVLFVRLGIIPGPAILDWGRVSRIQVAIRVWRLGFMQEANWFDQCRAAIDRGLKAREALKKTRILCSVSQENFLNRSSRKEE